MNFDVMVIFVTLEVQTSNCINCKNFDLYIFMYFSGFFKRMVDFCILLQRTFQFMHICALDGERVKVERVND